MIETPDGFSEGVLPRHVTDLAEARGLHPLAVGKYGPIARRSIGEGPPTPAEQATFELLPGAPG